VAGRNAEGRYWHKADMLNALRMSASGGKVAVTNR
jgi:hypothetical protein